MEAAILVSYREVGIVIYTTTEVPQQRKKKKSKKHTHTHCIGKQTRGGSYYPLNIGR